MTALAHTVGRLLLSVIFIVAGYNKLVAITGTVAYFRRLGVPAPEVVAWVAAIFEVAAGLMLLVGFKTRWVALALCAFTGIALFLGHKFWAAEAAQYNNQLNHALKNLAIMGGFLVLYASGPGPYSVDGNPAPADAGASTRLDYGRSARGLSEARAGGADASRRRRALW
jgi:putative oxidoreductase